MGFLQKFWEWTKGGMQLPKAKAFVESKPVLAKVLAYQPKTGIEAGLAATGLGLIGHLGVIAAAKVIGTGIIKAVPKVTKAIIPKTIKGKILGITAGFLGGGILLESKKAREFVKETAVGVLGKPEEVIGFGIQVGKFIEDEKEEQPGVLEGFKKAGIVGGLAALGIGAVVVAPKVIEKVKEWREGRPEEQLVKEKPIGIEGESVITPETTTITTGRKPYKRRKAKITPSVRQSVRVNIINKAIGTGMRITNKRYLSQELLN